MNQKQIKGFKFLSTVTTLFPFRSIPVLLLPPRLFLYRTNIKMRFFLLLQVFTTATSVYSFSLNANKKTTGTVTPSHWMDFLSFDGSTPDFDVIEKTKQYTSEEGYRRFVLRDIPTDYYDERYIFRGPIVGPINRKDLVDTNTEFSLDKAYPNLDRQPFGFTVDPENPYRVLFFERWKATHTGEVNLLGLLKAESTGKESVCPAFPFSIVWTPEGKIIYESLTAAVDRFEPNTTKGKVAVFGLLETAGIALDNNVGNPILAFQQRLARLLNAPAQVFSKDNEIPSWWKSQARGAERNDM